MAKFKCWDYRPSDEGGGDDAAREVEAVSASGAAEEFASSWIDELDRAEVWVKDEDDELTRWDVTAYRTVEYRVTQKKVQR